MLSTILHMAINKELPARGQSTTMLDLKELGLPEVPLLGIHSQLRARPGLAPHIHEGAMEICYLVKGEVVFSVGGRDYPLKGNDLFWTSPDETHGSGYHAYDKCLLYWTQIVLPVRPAPLLGLAGRDAWPLVQALRALPLRKFRGDRRLKGLFEEAFLLCRRPASELRRLGLAAILVQWLITVAECASRGVSEQYSDDIKRAVGVIEGKLEETVSVGDLAAVAGLSESRFKAKFREQIGIPPGEYVMRQRVHRAKDLLEKTSRSITEIAHSLGFSSSQYFANVFRRFMLVKPSDVRKGRHLPV
ncbi:MAG: hypothetical protein C0404_04005 [Verrucomicrobia bacterium]|nr:hypothetical protein [Verrucomicrobiota bacterium]